VAHNSVFRPGWAEQIYPILQHAPHSLLPYGLGRSYGDACLNQGRSLIDCSALNRFLAADLQEGWLRCESGASLGDILDFTVPRGWFLPVTPGTKFVTIGGAIANDVHGKNHHRAGTFGCHVRKLALCRSDAEIVICGPLQNADLFNATIGGLGLTGVILWAEIQLKAVQSTAIDVDILPFTSLEQFLALTEESDRDYEYTVAWVDSLSTRGAKGIFFRGNHSATSGQWHARRFKPGLPWDLPGWVLNRATVKAFNFCYFLRNRSRTERTRMPYDSFFYPLDSVSGWNRVYGKKGFLQYQCVVPEAAGHVFEELLARIADSGMGSFLAVLKRFGSLKSPGLLSFPRPGLTLALDFPMRGQKTLRLLEDLDTILQKAGGALYPAKDARMSPAMFAASFPNWRDLRPYLDAKLSSSLWRRVTEGAR
jgi:FAD/FMN-containing dehydrogenase